MLENLTSAKREFVDEKLLEIRQRIRELEDREEELQAMKSEAPNVEALLGEALAHVAKFRQVMEQGSIVERKEFLRGLVAGITLFPSRHEGKITFYSDMERPIVKGFLSGT